MSTPVHLNVHVTWRTLSRALELNAPSLALPLTMRCPLCRGNRFTVYQDNVSDGCWHYCFDCDHSGDSVSLAAAVWKISPELALRRLAHAGAEVSESGLNEESVQRHWRNHYEILKKVNRVWSESRKRLIQRQAPDVSVMLRALNLVESDLSNERWANGPASIFGSLPARAVREILCSGRIDKGRHEEYSHGFSKIFRGRGWKETLVLPFFNSPGQISAFWFIGKKGQPDDITRWRVHARHSANLKCEFGIAGLNAVLQDTSGVVIATDRPLVMLRLQMRHFRNSIRPLPIVAWQPPHRYGCTQDAWGNLQGRRLIFWSFRLDAPTLAHAIVYDADMATLGPEDDSRQTLNHYLKAFQPLDLKHRLEARAKPWREVLRNWSRRLTPVAFTTLIDQTMELQPRTARPLQEFIHEHLKPLSLVQSRFADVRHWRVFERNGNWTYRSSARGTPTATERELLRGVVRLHYMVNRGDGEADYVGELCGQGFVAPFCLPQKDLTFRKMQALALDQGHCLIPNYDERAPDLIETATAFYKPEVVQGLSRVGWDGKRFVFPRFCLSNGKAVLHEPWMLPENSPGPSMREFRLRKEVVKRFSMTGIEAEVSWGLICSVISTLLGPWTGAEAPGVLFTGVALKPTLEALLTRIGITHFQLPNDHPVWRHNWPLQPKLYATRHRHRCVLRYLLDQSLPRACMYAPTTDAYALALLGGFPVLHCDEILQAKAMSDFPAEHVFLGFLKHLSRCKLNGSSSLSPWEEAQRRLSLWLLRRGHNNEALLRSRRWISLPEDPDLPERLAACLSLKSDEPNSKFSPQEVDARLRGRGLPPLSWPESLTSPSLQRRFQLLTASRSNREYATG